MRIVTTYFDWEGSVKFEELTKAFAYSVIELGFPLDIIFSPPPKVNENHQNKPPSFLANTLKFQLWMNYFRVQPEGSDIVFMDSDMLLVGDPTHVFKDLEDLAYTRRSAHGKINSGVVFVRKNPRTTRFMERWLEINNEMLGSLYQELHKTYHKKYKGINQAAFGYMMENETTDIDLKVLPCDRYNVCDEDWKAPVVRNRVAIHYKSKLRRALDLVYIPKETNERRHMRFMRLVMLWREKYEAAQDLDLEQFKWTPTREEYKLVGCNTNENMCSSYEHSKPEIMEEEICHSIDLN